LAASFISNKANFVAYWHIAAFAATQHLGRDWTNNGQTSILARDGYDVNDPYRPCTLPYIVASARDDCDARKEAVNQSGENIVKPKYKLAIALIAGAAIGGAANQGLHAQAKPPAYIVIPILKINDAAAFKAGVVDKSMAADVTAAGGHYIIRSQKFIKVDGNPPERFVVIAFDSVEKAQAFLNTPAQKEVNAARIKSTNSLQFIVEGYAN
jgi:uncharacterized protein (DUF1330 family)